MSPTAQPLSFLFRRDLERLEQEISAFPDDASLWRVVPPITNAAGNLALHLEGNLREYIGRLLGGIDYTRDRDAEFRPTPLSVREVLDRVKALSATIPPIFEAVSDETLDSIYPLPFAGRPIVTREFLFHLYGHFNYHLGQIDYLRRAVTGVGALKLALY